MAKKIKKRLSLGWVLVIMALLFAELVILLWGMMSGNNIALFSPKGIIANEQYNLMIYSVAIMFSLAIPSLVLFYFIAWKYRETNSTATYEPGKKHGKWFQFVIWGLPTVFVLWLVLVMIPATQRLQPKDAIVSDKNPITIQVISMRWKWLFIYPEQNVATVNFVQIPVDTPVQFVLTADEAPMSSFWIPNLGGQLYSMTSHVNRLNLMADTAGDYPGSSAEINGAGFSGMKFIARVSSTEEFEHWVNQVKSSPDVLDIDMYESILKPSKNNPATYYSSYAPDIFDKVIAKYSSNSEENGHN